MKLRRVLGISVVVSAILWFLVLILSGINKSVFFANPIGDGPFQLLNSLRRLHGGYPLTAFHGQLVPYFFFPIYGLGGYTLYSAEFSRNLVSTLQYAISAVIIIVVLVKDRVQRMIVILSLLAFSWLFQRGLMLPSNSLLGIRSFLPLIVFSVMLMNLNNKAKLLTVVILSSASIYAGTEHGIALVVALFLGQIVYVVMHRPALWPRKLVNLGIGCALLLMVFIGMGIILTGSFSRLIETLQYNIVAVSHDQMWYFGVPPAPYLGAGISEKLLLLVWIDAIVFGISVFLLWKVRRSNVAQLRPDNRDLVLLTMLIYAGVTTTSYLGISTDDYLPPAERIIFLIVMILILESPRVTAYLNTLFNTSVRRMYGFLIVFSVIILMGGILAATGRGEVSRAFHLVKSLAQSAVGEDVHFGIQDGWKGYTTTVFPIIEAADNPHVWADYSALTQYQFNMFNDPNQPTFDYIIHPLGDQMREAYVQTFVSTRPDFVETQLFGFGDFSEWNRYTRWDYYEHILLNYTPAVSDPAVGLIFWRRNGLLWRSVDHTCIEYPVSNNQFVLKPGEMLPEGSNTEVIVVQATYQIVNPLHAIPVIGALPRYFAHISGAANTIPVSLSPYQTSQEFPVYRPAETEVLLRFDIDSLLPGASMRVSSVCIRAIAPDIHIPAALPT